MRDKINTESSKVCVCIIITVSADETAILIAAMMIILEATQICKHWLAESAVKLTKYDWDLRWN